AAHDNEKPPERQNDRRPGRQTPPEQQNRPRHSANKRYDPADQQSGTDPLREIDSTNRRRNQVTENQQHAGNADETSHDQTKECVKKKIPPANAQAFLVGAIAIE